MFLKQLKWRLFGCCLLIIINLMQGSSADLLGSKDLVRMSKAAEIRNYLDEQQNPCTDFYSFTCGNYYRINPPSLQALQTNFFQTITKSLSRKFTTLLKVDNATDTATDKIVKYFYESCMNVGSLKGVYKEKLKEIIGEFGQMPLLEGNKWREQDFDWLQIVAQIANRYEMRIILGYEIVPDQNNNTVNRLRMLLQDVPLGSLAIYTEPVHAVYRNARKSLITDRLKQFLGIDGNLAEKTASEIFEFEIDLFAGEDLEEDNTVLDKSKEDDNGEDGEDEDEGPQLTTTEQMQAKYLNKFDIKRFMSIALSLTANTEVYDSLEYDIDNIASILKKTPKRIVANYIFYYLIESFMLTAPKEQKQLHDLCIQTTKTHFAKVLDNMVYRKYTTRETEQDVTYMFETIKSAFHNVLSSDKLGWMKASTRSYALEKLKNIRMEINSYADADFVEEFGALKLTPNDYIENLRSILSLNAKKSRAKLTEVAKPFDDPQSLTFTPAFIRSENLVKVPVSILQPYYLCSDFYPNALKFGSLGFLMAHELVHGFDEEGRLYDKWGNKNNWWDPASSEYFHNYTKCFKTQYRSYIHNGIPLPELESQSENIADNGGIRLAYDAYLRWYEDAMRSFKSMDMETMPRLNYTSKQLFFISYGQLWCSATHPQLRNLVASMDVHVPEKFRVIGALSNVEAFAQEFGCTKQSQMNPTNRCIIY